MKKARFGPKSSRGSGLTKSTKVGLASSRHGKTVAACADMPKKYSISINMTAKGKMAS